MMRLWSQFLGTFVMIMLTAGGMYTTAYFFDIEESNPNTFAATSLDGLALGEPFDDLVCLFGGTSEKEFTFTNENVLPFVYNVSAEKVSGDGCGNIELTAFRNEAEVYSGSVGGFALSGFSLAPTSSDAWRLRVDHLLGTSTEETLCTFDTRFEANQESFGSGEAFYDIETLTHTITATTDTGTSTSCVPPGDTVDLQMDKHISGASNGFEESDFSYRIIGDGVNAVVPHGGSIALPKGTYTIEELVPEGFVKEDWRIGWYGECRRGSEFTTTIKIDDGNIDHGWLDCQADNQYRPELNRSRDDEESSFAGATEDKGTGSTTEIFVSSERTSVTSSSTEVAGASTSTEETENEHSGDQREGRTPRSSSTGSDEGSSSETTENKKTVLIETVSENEAKKKEPSFAEATEGEEEELVEENGLEESKEEDSTEEQKEDPIEENPTEATNTTE